MNTSNPGLGTGTLALLVLAAIALAALIFGLGGGVTVGNLAIWAVMMAAVASAVMLYNKPRAGSGGSGGPAKK